eukprot:Colp12_sorted_trinity150504_noHs@15575
MALSTLKPLDYHAEFWLYLSAGDLLRERDLAHHSLRKKFRPFLESLGINAKKTQLTIAKVLVDLLPSGKKRTQDRFALALFVIVEFLIWNRTPNVQRITPTGFSGNIVPIAQLAESPVTVISFPCRDKNVLKAALEHFIIHEVARHYRVFVPTTGPSSIASSPATSVPSSPSEMSPDSLALSPNDNFGDDEAVGSSPTPSDGQTGYDSAISSPVGSSGRSTPVHAFINNPNMYVSNTSTATVNTASDQLQLNDESQGYDLHRTASSLREMPLTFPSPIPDPGNNMSGSFQSIAEVSSPPLVVANQTFASSDVGRLSTAVMTAYVETLNLQNRKQELVAELQQVNLKLNAAHNQMNVAPMTGINNTLHSALNSSKVANVHQIQQQSFATSSQLPASAQMAETQQHLEQWYTPILPSVFAHASPSSFSPSGLREFEFENARQMLNQQPIATHQLPPERENRFQPSLKRSAEDNADLLPPFPTDVQRLKRQKINDANYYNFAIQSVNPSDHALSLTQNIIANPSPISTQMTEEFENSDDIGSCDFEVEPLEEINDWIDDVLNELDDDRLPDLSHVSITSAN